MLREPDRSTLAERGYYLVTPQRGEATPARLQFYHWLSRVADEKARR